MVGILESEDLGAAAAGQVTISSSNSTPGIVMKKYISTRGPWTAIPALIKVKETDKITSHFLHVKNYSKLLQFYGKELSVF